MLRKICPFCEKAMKLSHYCSDCRRFVKTPYIRDITYYLNESHPAGETDCEYHGDTGGRGRTPHPTVMWGNSAPGYARDGSQNTMRRGAGSQNAMWGNARSQNTMQRGTGSQSTMWGDASSQSTARGYTAPQSSASGHARSQNTMPGYDRLQNTISGYTGSQSTSGKTTSVPASFGGGFGGKAWSGQLADTLFGPGRKRTGTWNRQKAIFLIIGLFVVVEVLAVVKHLAGEFFTSRSYEEGEDYRILSDAEVQEQGVPCSSNGHYSISGVFLIDQMDWIIREAGCEIDTTVPSSWNYEDMGSDSSWTDYSSTVEFWLKTGEDQEEGGIIQTATVDYDTATGQLHGVSLFMTEAAPAAAITEGILNFLQEEGEIPSDEEYGTIVKDEILKYTDQEEKEQSGEWREIPEGGEERTEVYYRQNEENFYIRIWKNEY